MKPNKPAYAPRNRTVSCSPDEIAKYSQSLLRVERKLCGEDLRNRLISGDIFEIESYLPDKFVDLLILDPPYNLTKDFNGNKFKKMKGNDYVAWFDKTIRMLSRLLKPTATIYICADWKTSALVLPTLEEVFHVQNRITWERDKGRGAKSNWKNNTEDIWFCTNSKAYYFDVDSVKLKRKVLAPYRMNGVPKDWKQEDDGNYRLTCPSNIWTDLTVPFWSMPENTPHPTQKPEKLVAKLVLASSKKGDFVFDPFLGSGTTAVVAEKLGRVWCGVDINTEYLCWARKRISSAQGSPAIQGYENGVFWERNSYSKKQSRNKPAKPSKPLQESFLK